MQCCLSQQSRKGVQVAFRVKPHHNPGCFFASFCVCGLPPEFSPPVPGFLFKDFGTLLVHSMVVIIGMYCCNPILIILSLYCVLMFHSSLLQISSCVANVAFVTQSMHGASYRMSFFPMYCQVEAPSPLKLFYNFHLAKLAHCMYTQLLNGLKLFLECQNSGNWRNSNFFNSDSSAHGSPGRSHSPIICIFCQLYYQCSNL